MGVQHEQSVQHRRAGCKFHNLHLYSALSVKNVVDFPVKLVFQVPPTNLMLKSHWNDKEYDFFQMNWVEPWMHSNVWLVTANAKFMDPLTAKGFWVELLAPLCRGRKQRCKCSWRGKAYRAPLIGGPQVLWILFLLLLTTSTSTCLKHSHNLGPAY